MKEKEKDERYFKQVSTRFHHQNMQRHLNVCQCGHIHKKIAFGAFKNHHPEDYRLHCSHSEGLQTC